MELYCGEGEKNDNKDTDRMMNKELRVERPFIQDGTGLFETVTSQLKTKE